MKKHLDIETILSPFPGGNPSGESLRYDTLYDEIREARRADDQLERGDWQQEIKTSDWDRVFDLSVSALTERTKDIQIAAWLLESLANLEGFAGVQVGLKIITGFLADFWETVYPELEDGDLDYRVGPLEFINDKVWLVIKQLPLTDGPGYSWLQWQESRQGTGEEKLKPEDFERGITSSSRSFYETLHEQITACRQEFSRLDEIVDEKFGREAPRLAEFKSALEDCNFLVGKILNEKREQDEDIAGPEKETSPEELVAGNDQAVVGEPPAMVPDPVAQVTGQAQIYRVNRLLGSAGIEAAVWQEALAKLGSDGIREALEHLLGASCCAQSMREKTNFRLLMAMLCLKAKRPDLARPIAEELNTLMEDLQLVKWESPIWVADVLDTLYQCLTAEGASDEDIYRAKEVWRKICTLDVTKAMGHMS